jgi:hypothetical protein
MIRCPLETAYRICRHNYRALRQAHADDLRTGRDASRSRAEMLFFAAELTELRRRLRGEEPNLCY